MQEEPPNPPPVVYRDQMNRSRQPSIFPYPTSGFLLALLFVASGTSLPTLGGFYRGGAAQRRSGSVEAKSNGKPDKEKKGGGGGTPPTPKDSKPRKPAVPKASAAGHGTPRTADKSPGSGSADRKAPTPKAAASRLATTPEKGKPAKPPQEQQAQLAAIREELRAKKVADEANAKLQDALDVQRRAIEAQEADKLPAGESEQASIHGQQEADDAVLRSTVEQLEKARYELVDAIDAKNEALSQVDDAVRASEVKAQEVEHLTTEVITHLKGQLDSKVDGNRKKTAERI
uniref:Uncharacterized protein n=1 Tax=Zea mays TaxID=4577 RepID=A0A804PEA2_MAIZE